MLQPNFKNKRLLKLSAVIADFSAAPLRLFFLSACLSAMVGASCWSLVFLGGWRFVTDPLNLHAFFFLQSLAGAVYAGFLFTAIPEWTSDRTPLSKPMQRLWLLWLVASFVAPFSLASALLVMTVYWFYVIALATWLVWKNRDHRQVSVLLFVYSVTAMTMWLCIKAWFSEINAHDWRQLLHLGLLGIALISFRISQALGTQALEDSGQDDSRFIPNPFYKNLAVWLFYALIISNLILQNSAVSGWLHLAIAGVMIGRLREWHFFILLKQHYVWWLYLTLLLIGIGYSWRGLTLIENSTSALFNPVLPLHLIAIGGFLLMVYQVFNIAGLRHSNRDLIYPLTSRVGLVCLLLAALSRSLAVGLSWNYVYFAVYLPNVLLVLAFLMYLPVFYRIFIRYPAATPAQ